MLAFTICLLLVLIIFGGGYFAYVLLFQDDVAEQDIPNAVIIHDDLSRAILALINDTYSPFFEAQLHHRLVSDLDIDSLDVIDLMFDVSQIAATPLNANDLRRQYGRNPTVAQLISYVRSEMQSVQPSSVE